MTNCRQCISDLRLVFGLLQAVEKLQSHLGRPLRTLEVWLAVLLCLKEVKSAVVSCAISQPFSSMCVSVVFVALVECRWDVSRAGLRCCSMRRLEPST